LHVILRLTVIILEGPLLDYAMKVYRGHRVVPVGVTDQLKLKYEKYLAIKKEKLK
jgi:hypothetical protein